MRRARRDAELRQIDNERRELEAQLRASRPPPPRPRPDAPVNRPTKASLAASPPTLMAASSTEHPAAPKSVDAETRDDLIDPFKGTEPLRLDPRVLAMLGEDIDDASLASSSGNAATPAIDDNDDKVARTSPPKRETSPPKPASIGFFDALSSAERGRKQVRDPRLFQPATMRRVTGDAGVVVLAGCLAEEPHDELTICLLFDRHRFTEQQAASWWEGRGRAICARS